MEIINRLSKAETISKVRVHSHLLHNYLICKNLYFVNEEVWAEGLKLGRATLVTSILIPILLMYILYLN